MFVDHAVVAPLGSLADGFSQDPQADIDDDVGFLGQGYEAVWAEQSVDRMMSTQQCFGARDQTGVDVDLGLIVNSQLPAADATMKVAS